MRFRVRFDPQAPLLLGTGGVTQQVRESALVIPGGAVAGAVARVLLQQEGTFRENPFLPEPQATSETGRLLAELRFSPLYPVPAEPAGEAAGSTWASIESYHAPCSARTCKRFPGYHEPARGSGRSGDGVVDQLLPRLFGESRSSQGPHASPDEDAPMRHCPVNPAHRLERFRASVYRLPAGDGRWAYGEARVPTEPRVRVGLSRYTEAAEEGILFQVDAVEPRRRVGAARAAGSNGAAREEGLVFLGDGWLPDELWPQLQARMQAFGPDAASLQVAVGGARARGYGDGLLTLRPAPSTRASVAQRLERFTVVWKQKTGGETLLIPALLRSPWPLTDPVRSPGDELLRAARPPEGLRDRLQYAASLSALETEPWGGWSMAWGLPRTRRLALAAGSVLIFRLNGYRPDRDREPLLDWLTLCEECPAAPEPGTGWVTWFDPFHLDHATEKEVAQ